MIKFHLCLKVGILTLDIFHLNKKFTLILIILLMLIPMMIISASFNIYASINFGFSNGTISKIFLTVIALAYLKHFDEWLISHKKLNNLLDIIAKYSFGIFFIHWYVFFLYNLTFGLPNVMTVIGNIGATLGLVFIRFIVVTSFSVFTLWVTKQFILKINPEANTRSFIGV